MNKQKSIKEHQDWIEGLLHSGLNSFTMKEFAKRYLYVENINTRTKCEHKWIDENLLKIGKIVFQFK